MSDRTRTDAVSARQPSPRGGVRVSIEQQEQELDPEQAETLALTGRAALVGTTQLVMRGNDVLEIPTQNLERAVARGWRLTDSEGARTARVRREESGFVGGAIGTAERTLGGLTLGLSQAAERELGVSPERMAARAEEAGPFGVIGELAGAVAPAAFTGGASLGARAGLGVGARALALTPAGLLTRGAAATGARVAARVGTGSAMRRVLPLTTQSAVEGFGFGAGAQLGEDALGNRELALDRILASGGMGMLLGGATGPLLALGGRTTARGSAAVLRRATGFADEGIPSALERAFAAGNVKKAAKLMGVSEAEIAPIAGHLATTPGRNLLRTVRDEPEVLIEKAAEGVRGPTEALRDAIIDFRVGIGREAKMRAAGEQIAPHLRDAAVSRADDVLRAYRTRIDEALTANQAAGGKLMDDGALYQLKAQADRAAAIMDSVERKIGARPGRGAGLATVRNIDDDTIGLVYDTLDSLKRDGYATYTQVKKSAGGFGPPTAAQNTKSFMMGELGLRGVREFLEDHAFWGGRGLAQKEVNDLASTARKAREGLLDSASKHILDTYRPVISNADLVSLIEKGPRFKGQQAFEQFREVVGAELRAMEARARHYKLPASELATLSRARTALKAWDEAYAKSQDVLRKRETLKLLQRRDAEDTGVSPAMAALAGGAIGGPVGGIVGGVGAAVLRARNRPFAMLNRLLNMTRGIDRGVGQQRGAMRNFLVKLGKKATKAAEDSGPVFERLGRVGVAAVARLGAKDREERDKLVDERVRAMANNPAMIEDTVRQATAHLEDTVPGYTAGAFGRLSAAASFLAAKAPKEYSDPWSTGPGLVDPIAQAKYSRYIEAVDTPFVAVARLGDGTFSREHAEALEAVYPALWADVKNVVYAALAEAEQVPYDVRVTLGNLFGASFDPMASPKVVGRLQLMLNAPPTPRAPHVNAGGAQPRPNMMTGAQRVERGLQ